MVDSYCAMNFQFYAKIVSVKEITSLVLLGEVGSWQEPIVPDPMHSMEGKS